MQNNEQSPEAAKNAKPKAELFGCKFNGEHIWGLYRQGQNDVVFRIGSIVKVTVSRMATVQHERVGQMLLNVTKLLSFGGDVLLVGEVLTLKARHYHSL